MATVVGGTACQGGGDPPKGELLPAPCLLDAHPDLDGDGWGDGSEPSRSFVCDQVPAEWAAPGDCDDSDAEVGTPALWYPDKDGDGHGDCSRPVSSCEAIPGLLATCSDCDDSRSGVHPDAIEVCGDGLDNDCEPRESPCGLPWWLDREDDADRWWQGGADFEELGRVIAVGDLTGDGWTDLLMGALDGFVHIVPGSALGLTQSHWLSSATRLTIESEADVLEVADIDGDGFVDVLTGSRDQVLVYPGPVGGDTDASAARTVLELDGGYLDGVFELTGDEFPDLIVFEPREQLRVYPGPLPVGVVAISELPSFGVPMVQPSSWAVGDFDGDGAEDLAVGSSDSPLGSTWVDEGRVALFRGPIDGASLEPYAEVVGDRLDRLGMQLVGAGDQDGDGDDDLIVLGESRAFLIRDLVAGERLIGEVVEATLDHMATGFPSSYVGDVNADGRDDLFMDSRLLLGPVPDGGNVYSEATTVLWAEGCAAPLSTRAGDLNNDGIDDWFLSDPGEGCLDWGSSSNTWLNTEPGYGMVFYGWTE